MTEIVHGAVETGPMLILLGVSFKSFLIRSMFASLLATICSAVSCGSPVESARPCLVALLPLPAFAVFADPACFGPGGHSLRGPVAHLARHRARR